MAFGPPDDVVGRAEVRFTMADVGAGDVAVPKTKHHFFGGEVAPAAGEIAFVFYLIVNDGFAVGVAVKLRAAWFLDGGAILNAGVGDPGLVVVVNQCAVVDGAQVRVRIALLDDEAEAVPVRFGFFFHEIVFVGEGPPDVAIGGESGDDVAQVAIIARGIHAIKAPATFVVGVK